MTDGTPAGAGDTTTSNNDSLSHVPLEGLEVAALDFETTGLSAWRGDEVCEVGLVQAVGPNVEPLLSTFVNPGKRIPPIVQGITGICDADVVGAPLFKVVLPKIYELIGRRPLVLHNAPFDLAFLKRGADAHGMKMLDNLAIDTLLISRHLNQGRQMNSLSQVSKRLQIPQGRSHRATDDASTAARVFHALLPDLAERGIRTIGELAAAGLAAPADELVAAPSSVILDMLTRAVDQRSLVVITCTRRDDSDILTYHVRPLALAADRELTVEVLKEKIGTSEQAVLSGDHRVFRVHDIMTMKHGGVTFVSPWAKPDHVRRVERMS